MGMEAAAEGLGEHRIEDVYHALGAHVPDMGPSKVAARTAAVAMVLNDQAGLGLSALFIKRAEHPDDPWSGQMAFPGGRFEPHDKSLDAAARRETLEEVGVELAEDMLIGRLSDVTGGRLTAQNLSVSPFVFDHPGPIELKPNYEVADTVWVPLAYLGDPANIQPYLFPLDPTGRGFPSWQYEGYTIWGLTYRIVASYLHLFGVTIPGEGDATGAR